jgi:hypothetical protein
MELGAIPAQLVWQKWTPLYLGGIIVLDRKKAMNLWKQTFGEATEAKDYRGRSIYKSAYGQHGSQFGWDVHHKQPKSQGGTDAFDNLQIVHVATHDEIHGR